jgi:hypothetical protein
MPSWRGAAKESIASEACPQDLEMLSAYSLTSTHTRVFHRVAAYVANVYVCMSGAVRGGRIKLDSAIRARVKIPFKLFKVSGTLGAGTSPCWQRVRFDFGSMLDDHRSHLVSRVKVALRGLLMCTASLEICTAVSLRLQRRWRPNLLAISMVARCRA